MNTKTEIKEKAQSSLPDPGMIEKIFPFAKPLRTLTAAILVSSSSAWAGGVVLNCTEADLRTALVGGGSVTFACDGTITLANTITNGTATVIEASGHQVTISGGARVQVFYVRTNASLTLVHLTISDGLAGGGYPFPNGLGGGVVNDGGTLNLRGVTFQANVAARAGAIFNQGGIVNATNCGFFGNQAQPIPKPGMLAEAHGGAILNQGGQVNLQDCVFTANQATGANPYEVFQDSTIGSGGAVENSGILIVNRCTFLQNAAKGGDGWSARFGPAGSPGTRGAMGKGGAIVNNGTLTIASSSFLSNTVVGGRGGEGASGAVGPYPPNQDDGGPGGPGAPGDSAYGGALFNQGAASATNCTFAWNTARGGAGGAGGNGGVALFHGDKAPAGGPGGNGGSAFGGIYGGLYLKNCTLAFNSATNGAGGTGGLGGLGNGVPSGPAGANGTAGVAGGAITGGACVNTLLATNIPGGNCYSSITDLGHNLSSDATCAFTSIGSMNSTDPRLGPLANNGGPTLTMALLPGSPAIDAGDAAAAPKTDQRGVSRPFSLSADIGAFEFWPTLQARRSVSGGIDITAFGISGQICRLLATSNFANWIPIATNQIGSDGTALFHYNPGIGNDYRFFRLAIP